MTRRDLSKRDASHHAASELDYIIRSESYGADSKVQKVSAEEAMTGDRVIETDTSRNITRVLFISQNTDLLNPTRQTLDGYLNISDLFQEVHILILRRGITPKNPVLRVAKNVWLYTAAATCWWQLPWAGLRMAEDQLEFASGFRPDLIVARDAFESAVVAQKLGEKYGKATQLHVLDDYTAASFLKQSRRNFWRLVLPKYTIPRFRSIRTLTDVMRGRLERDYEIPDIKTLPRFQNYEALIDSPVQIDLKQKYKGFIFFMLFVGDLNYQSTLHEVLDAARFVLTNQRVGLLVLGEGKTKREFEKRAKTLGIENQVIFENRPADIVPYLKSANMLLVTDTGYQSDELTLQAAAAGIPMVMTRTDRREDIFVDEKSAFICEPSDVQSISNRINDLLNDIELRKVFVHEGQTAIRERFHNNLQIYRESYRSSIEEVLFLPELDL